MRPCPDLVYEGTAIAVQAVSVGIPLLPAARRWRVAVDIDEGHVVVFPLVADVSAPALAPSHSDDAVGLPNALKTVMPGIRAQLRACEKERHYKALLVGRILLTFVNRSLSTKGIVFIARIDGLKS